MNEIEKNTAMIGWREWLALPDLGIKKIKAKIDTGAKTSTLHAFAIESKKKNGKHIVQFGVHPMQRRIDVVAVCEASVLDVRWVMDSGGHRERRYIIETRIVMADQSWPIELTLTNRDSMRFRMLLGRTAVKHHFVVDPAASYLTKKDK